jgi:hypothetical protein
MTRSLRPHNGASTTFLPHCGVTDVHVKIEWGAVIIRNVYGIGLFYDVKVKVKQYLHGRGQAQGLTGGSGRQV